MSDHSQRVRSPLFPFIGLRKALERAEELHEHERWAWVNLSVAIKHWGFSGTSSNGKQTIAALNAFGLIETKGAKVHRSIRLSELARRIILDPNEESQRRIEAIQDAALKPKIYKKLLDHYDGNLPSDANLRYMLLIELNPPFNERSVDLFIRTFKETLAFARITGSDTMPDQNEDIEEEPVEPSATDTLPKITQPQPQPQPQLAPGTHQAAFPLPQGTITLQWPSPLSPEDIEDIEGWLDLIKKRLNRFVRKEDGD